MEVGDGECGGMGIMGMGGGHVVDGRCWRWGHLEGVSMGLELDGTMGRFVGRLKKLMPYSCASSPLAKLRIFSCVASNSSS
jgi:hypothetical protein